MKYYTRLYKAIRITYLTALLIAFSLSFSSCGGDDNASNGSAQDKNETRPNKVVIISLDVSTSMRWPGSNIFSEVKESLGKFINPLRNGDIVVFMTFAQEIKVYPEIEIKSSDSKEPLLKIIQSFDANGTATYTSYMLTQLYEQYKKMKSKYPNHYITAVVLSDGYDKPPAGKKRISLKDYIRKDQQGTIDDWYIHYIALGILDKRIEKDLKSVVSKSKFHKVNIKDKKTTDQKLTKLTEKLDKKVDEEIVRDDENKTTNLVIIFLILLLIIAAIVIILYLNWRKKKLLLHGFISFWNNTEYQPEVKMISLGDFEKKEFSMAKKAESDLQIPDLRINQVIFIRPKFIKGKVVPIIEYKGKNRINFKMHTGNREYLIHNDMFSISNYSFKYTES